METKNSRLKNKSPIKQTEGPMFSRQEASILFIGLHIENALDASCELFHSNPEMISDFGILQSHFKTAYSVFKELSSRHIKNINWEKLDSFHYSDFGWEFLEKIMCDFDLQKIERGER